MYASSISVVRMVQRFEGTDHKEGRKTDDALLPFHEGPSAARLSRIPMGGLALPKDESSSSELLY